MTEGHLRTHFKISATESHFSVGRKCLRKGPFNSLEIPYPIFFVDAVGMKAQNTVFNLDMLLVCVQSSISRAHLGTIKPLLLESRTVAEFFKPNNVPIAFFCRNTIFFSFKHYFLAVNFLHNITCVFIKLYTVSPQGGDYEILFFFQPPIQ